MTHALIWIVAILSISTGLLGTLLPALPGSPLIFFGIVLIAWIDNFTRIGTFVLITEGALLLAALAVDFVAAAAGAKRVGASSLAVIGSAVGTVVGIFLGIPGIIFGPLIGAMLGELVAQRRSPDFAKIGTVGIGTWIGLLLGTAIRIAIAFVMVGLAILAFFV